MTRPVELGLVAFATVALEALVAAGGVVVHGDVAPMPRVASLLLGGAAICGVGLLGGLASRRASAGLWLGMGLVPLVALGLGRSGGFVDDGLPLGSMVSEIGWNELARLPRAVLLFVWLDGPRTARFGRLRWFVPIVVLIGQTVAIGMPWVVPGVALQLTFALLPLAVVHEPGGWFDATLPRIVQNPAPWLLLAIVAPIFGLCTLLLTGALLVGDPDVALQRVMIGSWDAPFVYLWIPSAAAELVYGAIAAIAAAGFHPVVAAADP